MSNPLAHEITTAVEILQATNNGRDIDVMVMGAGTGGTISGVSRALKRAAPHIKVIRLGDVIALLGHCRGSTRIFLAAI